MNKNDFLDFAHENFNEKYITEVPMEGIHPTVVDYIRHTAGVLRAPTNLVFGEVITVLGSMLGKKVTVLDGFYRNRCNLFSAIVGVASGAKSPTLNYVMKSVNKLDKERHEPYEKAYHAAKKNGEELPVYKQIVASNETIEDLYRVLDNVKNAESGLLFHQDELLNFFGKNIKKYSDGNIVSDFLSLFDGFTPLRVGRVSMDKRIFIEDPFLAILGGIQKKRIDELFAGQEHNGFFSRWQFWLSNEDSPFIDDNDIAAEQNWNDILERATDDKMKNLILQFQAVKQVRALDDDYRKLRDSLEEDDEDDLSETIMKQGYIIRRLSGIIHCMNALAEGYRPADTIRCETVEYAEKVIEWLFTNSCIVQRYIEAKKRKKISGPEGIVAVDAAYGIKNMSKFSESLGGRPSQPYISRLLEAAKSK